ncbi:outer membrane protein assembly factor BamD [Conservatibacter flavescens]|uniref:Outer membrane protein assembly factor BamD n=1 Tax=Conservatibacter flavescens TaxID=28161 RepID=A0A2M8S0A1_9PAST|nr:outer membrane protein assembly factor BamD [Conservatibacter flavescens]PJG84582.1 outer membrane protein assembly factor BamD [Conservatibacter flavescens]
MRKLKSFVFIALAALTISACSNSKSEVEQGSAQELYNKGETYLQDGDYTQAIRYLEATENRFPFGNYSEQTQLNLIYAYYKAQDYTQTLTTAERFLRQHPNSPNLDYVLYMAGLTNTALGENWMQNLFSVDRASREPVSVLNAFGNFQTLVHNFPNSIYVPDALARMAYLKARLARHELKIAEFYADRNAYVAVVNRVEGMLRQYSDTQETYQALPLMKRAYEEMGLTKMANDVQRIIDANKDKQFADIEKPKEPELSVPKAQ